MSEFVPGALSRFSPSDPAFSLGEMDIQQVLPLSVEPSIHMEGESLFARNRRCLLMNSLLTLFAHEGHMPCESFDTLDRFTIVCSTATHVSAVFTRLHQAQITDNSCLVSDCTVTASLSYFIHNEQHIGISSFFNMPHDMKHRHPATGYNTHGLCQSRPARP